jgi:hypothetical protein
MNTGGKALETRRTRKTVDPVRVTYEQHLRHTMQEAQSGMLGEFTPSVSSPPSTREPEFLVHSEFERLAPPDAAWAPLNESSGGRNSPYSGSLGHVGDNDEDMVGVGILMQQDPKDGALYVKSCVRGGAAGPCRPRAICPAPAPAHPLLAAYAAASMMQRWQLPAVCIRAMLPGAHRATRAPASRGPI